jgi:hypothetical protein
MVFHYPILHFFVFCSKPNVSIINKTPNVCVKFNKISLRLHFSSFHLVGLSLLITDSRIILFLRL